MIKKAILSGTLLLSVLALRSQDLTLNLDQRAEDAQYKKLIMVSPVFALRGDSVANPLDISSALADDPVYWRKVSLPKMNPLFKSGFTWIYDGSSELEFAKAYTLLVIENPNQTYYPARIWVDKNHNFDLTDDGDPDSLTLTGGVEVSLGHANGYHVYLEHFPSEKFKSFEAMNDKAIRKLQGNREFLGTGASLREKRLNVLSANYSNGRDSFQIGIKDVNCNGRYNEDHDVVMITTFRGVFDNLQGVKLENGKAYLEWDNAGFRITSVDPLGAWIQVTRDTGSRLKYSLNKGDKLPRFKYCSATKPSRHKSIRRLKGKYIYIYVWRDGAEEFYRDSADWHALGRIKSENFEVLGLNYGASARYVYQYNILYETAIRQGYSSNDINRTLMLKQVPSGILIDKKQRIIGVGITPAEVQGLLGDQIR